MVRLTREEFIALARLRGYSLAAVARLWGISRSRMSQIAGDICRKSYWDYALWGLPSKSATARVESRRSRSLASLGSTNVRRNRIESVEIGDVWLVRDSPGDHLPEGAEGTVLTLTVREGEWRALICFPATAYKESYSLSYLSQPDCFLCATGRNLRPGTPADPNSRE
jgi:hypothetical protein